mmetsp:Transcript_6587/g.11456  ORF Transcript_6587/g.11456 Transcript_6587/m.11456 type:complete len:170 (-) Transcript_6587:89-598(-)
MGATINCCLNEDGKQEKVYEGQGDAIGHEMNGGRTAATSELVTGPEGVSQMVDVLPPPAEEKVRPAPISPPAGEVPPSSSKLKRVLLRRAPGDLLGMDLQHGGDHLIVTTIHPGKQVDRHNRSHGPEQQIHVGDTILGVNDVKGSDQAMVDTCKENLEVTLLLQPAGSQ